MLHRVIVTLLTHILFASSACLPERYKGMTSNEIIYNCFQSGNYLSDVQKMDNTTDKIYLLFDTSTIPKIVDNSFEILGETLIVLGVIHSGLRDIENHAFSGLSKLRILNLEKNYLKVLKSNWFDDLHDLQELNVARNQINYVDSDIFAKIPLLTNLNIGENQLSCFDVEKAKSWEQLKTAILFPNPFDMECGCKAIDWGRKSQHIFESPSLDTSLITIIYMYYNCTINTTEDYSSDADFTNPRGNSTNS